MIEDNQDALDIRAISNPMLDKANNFGPTKDMQSFGRDDESKHTTNTIEKSSAYGTANNSPNKFVKKKEDGQLELAVPGGSTDAKKDNLIKMMSDKDK